MTESANLLGTGPWDRELSAARAASLDRHFLAEDYCKQAIQNDNRAAQRLINLIRDLKGSDWKKFGNTVAYKLLDPKPISYETRKQNILHLRAITPNVCRVALLIKIIEPAIANEEIDRLKLKTPQHADDLEYIKHQTDQNILKLAAVILPSAQNLAILNARVHQATLKFSYHPSYKEEVELLSSLSVVSARQLSQLLTQERF